MGIHNGDGESTTPTEPKTSLTEDQIIYYKGECKKAYADLIEALRISMLGNEKITITNEVTKVLDSCKNDAVLQFYYSSFITTGEGWIAAVNSAEKENLLAKIDILKDTFVEDDYVPANFDIAWANKQREDEFKKETGLSVDEVRTRIDNSMKEYRESAKQFKEKLSASAAEVDARYTIAEKVVGCVIAVAAIAGIIFLGVKMLASDNSGDVIILDE